MGSMLLGIAARGTPERFTFFSVTVPFGSGVSDVRRLERFVVTLTEIGS
jgi:hypothetical protein